MPKATFVRPEPCASCPYRCDVPSGVWAAEEYAKLARYDAPTGDQPHTAFACHASPRWLCHGWAVVHSSRGHDRELLALRIMPSLLRSPVAIPKAAVPLFESGADAAAHGQREIAHPSPEAQRMRARLLAQYPRLTLG